MPAHERSDTPRQTGGPSEANSTRAARTAIDALAEVAPSREALTSALDALERARAAIQDQADQLNGVAELRDRIADLGRRIADVCAMPPASATAGRLLASVVGRLDLSDAEWAAHAASKPASAHESVSLSVRRLDLTLALVAHLLAEAIASSRPGVAEGDRAERLATLGRELLDAELAEESIIREAEASGLSIRRRADANPAAVLADAKDLPR